MQIMCQSIVKNKGVRQIEVFGPCALVEYQPRVKLHGARNARNNSNLVLLLLLLK